MPQLADVLNQNCQCETTDSGHLTALIAGAGETGPIFSASPLYVSCEHYGRMQATIAAVETVVHRPDYAATLAFDVPPIARTDHGPRGVFFSYDFHLSEDGPKLIEINTNAGGALLNLALSRAQRACCEEVEPWMTGVSEHAEAEAAIVEMFREEWRLAGRETALQTIAIVDDDPEGQFLYPEFVLFERLLDNAGFATFIADPKDLRWDGERLRHCRAGVDLVYNRLTDFHLEEPAHADLRAAYEAGAVVLTPHPRAYALYADKRNLTVLSDKDRLAEMGVAAEDVAVLTESIPQTLLVTDDNAEQLWAERKRFFFKPAIGYGSKAAYRGDKITKGAWETVLQGNYVAQRIVRPSERVVNVNGGNKPFKVDVRCYVYDGKIQTVAARLYQGQTTNLRSEGGGFAAVYLTP